MAVLVPRKRGPNTPSRSLIVACVTSIWKSSKQPKLVTSGVPISHVCAFRCIELQPMDESIAMYQAGEDALPWVLKPHAVVAVLGAYDGPEAVDLSVHRFKIQLSGESVGILDASASAPQWWPTEEDADEEAQPQQRNASGLFQSKKRKRAAGNAKAKAAKIAAAKEANKFAEKTRKKRRARRAKAALEGAPCMRKLTLLKKAKNEKVLPWAEKLVRRNGSGPVLVSQMMIKLRSLEEEHFNGEKMCFDSDDKCVLKHAKCQNVTWENVVEHTHPYFCAE